MWAHDLSTYGKYVCVGCGGKEDALTVFYAWEKSTKRQNPSKDKFLEGFRMPELIGRLLSLHFAGRGFRVRVRGTDGSEYEIEAYGIEQVSNDRIRLVGAYPSGAFRYEDILDVKEL